MAETPLAPRRLRVRQLVTWTLALGLTVSMMYVSFAFGFRAGIAEDTVYILPQQC